MNTHQHLRQQYARLKKRIARLSFQRLSSKKQQQLRRRLQGCENTLLHLGSIAALTTFGTSHLQAQAYCPRGGADNPFNGLDAGLRSTPQLVDVDGDGNLDLLSGENTGSFVYFRNDGSDNFTQQTGTDNPFDGLSVGFYSTPQLVDVDGDGDLDLLSGESGGNFVYYQNDGSNNFTQQTGTDNPFNGLNVGNRSTPQLVDVDGDGNLDLLSGGSDGTFAYYRNDGSDNFIQQTGTDNPFDGFDVGDNSNPQLIDVDGDGNLDLVSGEFVGTFVYYQNDGSNNFTQQTGTDNPFNGFDVGLSSAPQLVDVDSDGDLDLLSGEFYGGFVYFQNEPTCLPASVDGYIDCVNDSFDGLSAGERSYPQLIDIDSDGDLDLFSGSYEGGYNTFKFYQNDGNNNFTQQTGAANPLDGVNDNYYYYSSLQLVDVDSDGDLDLLSGEEDGTFVYYQNDGSDNFTQQMGTDNPFNGFDVGEYSTPYLADLDGDGNLDLVSGEEYGTFVYYQNDGSNNFIQQIGTNNPFDGFDVGDNSTPRLVDADGDNDLDLVSGSIDGTFAYFQNDGSSNFTQQTGTDNPFNGLDAGSASVPQLVDVDGDGDLDLLSGVGDGTFVYYQNINLSVSASTAGCTSNEGEVELTVMSSDTEGPYTVSNAFSGTIGMAGQIGAMETIMTGITEPGTYVFEVTDTDGCVQIATTVDINQNCALPVELLYFEAKATQQNQAKLIWATASETDNSHFIIERSSNGKQFAAIGKVQGAGTTLEEQQYHFVDETPFEGMNYYRLQQVDGDGAYEYSEIEAVRINSKNETLAFFPIPAREVLNYNTAQLEGVEAIHLFDMLGRLVKTDRALDGSLDILDLPSGQYTLVFEGKGQHVHHLVQKL